MKFKDNVPIFLQIKETINSRIVEGQYKMGQKISSVRDLSVEFEVNMNTMQRALTELIKEGVLITRRGLGNFITEDFEVVDSLKVQMINNIIGNMYDSLSDMGLTEEEITSNINKFMKEDKDE